ncbi:MAG: hypothetical protein WC277_03590 [Bacilli bacterium]
MKAILDGDRIKEALLSEGLTEDQMTYDTDILRTFDDGFYSWRLEAGYPRLIHFYTIPEKRSFLTAIRMMRRFRDELVREGHLFYIVELPKSKPYIRRFIEYIKGKKYLEIDGDAYYYAPTTGRTRHESV